MKPRAIAIWGVGYLALIAALVYAMFRIRDRTLESMSTPEAQAAWQQWRDEAAKQSAEGPVARRITKSAEPPALVLMRDSFPSLLGGAIVFTTLLYLAVAWLMQGAMRRPAGDKRMCAGNGAG